MAKRSPNYALVFGILIVAVIATYWMREKPTQVLFSPDLASFPKKISRWDGQDMEMTKEVRDLLNADTVLSRSYVNTQYGDDAGLLVVYRKYGRRDFIHRPEACYPAAGWKIVETGFTTLPYNGKNVQAVKVIAEKDGAREIIVYWFASGDRTVANYMKQQYMMAMDRFQTRKYGWTFIRVNCRVLDSDEATMDTIRGFCRSISDPLVKVLSVPAKS
ncbi:MAG: exosortase C-terminal domain/associated protein EpsI [Armatimonadota bacterium]|nr:EpsI family protein [bacterium]